MKINELIAKLQEFQKQLGNVEVTVADGLDLNFYEGDFQVIAWHDGDGVRVEIGVGGCRVGDDE